MTLATTDFKTEFAVDMTCQSCVDDVSSALRSVQGVERYDIDLENKRVVITGRAPPSHLFAALKATERQVIVRGTSSMSTTVPSTAAVSILESPIPLPTSIASTSNPILASSPSSSPQPPSAPLPGLAEEFSQKVFGICRFVQIAPRLVLMDLTVRLPPAMNVGLNPTAGWDVYISSTGNMIDPPRTTGKAFRRLGEIVPDGKGYGDMFQEVEGELWEWVGRGCVVQAKTAESGRTSPGTSGSEAPAPAPAGTGTIFAGVVARSAGAWGNDKTVCACSGRTMWEEGRDMEKKSVM